MKMWYCFAKDRNYREETAEKIKSTFVGFVSDDPYTAIVQGGTLGVKFST